jgi:hypothetical protein
MILLHSSLHLPDISYVGIINFCTGILGTTKGRLFPTRNTALFNLYPLGIVSVSAGANFTAVVTTAGSVYR